MKSRVSNKNKRTKTRCYACQGNVDWKNMAVYVPLNSHKVDSSESSYALDKNCAQEIETWILLRQSLTKPKKGVRISGVNRQS